jgi:hypothetical protein
MRTVKNRLSRQHIDSNNKYNHPVWNIDDPIFRMDVSGLSSLQTTHELNIINSLTIDNDLHPSTLGYLYIIANAVTADHEKSLTLAKTVYMAGINSLSANLTKKPTQKYLFCGTSKVLTSLLNVLPISLRTALSAAGIDILAPGEIPESHSQKGQIENLMYITDHKIDDQESLNKCIADIHKKLSDTASAKISILFWDALATQVMQWRARNLRNAPTGLTEKHLAANTFYAFWPERSPNFDFHLIDRLIEHGAGGAPTFWGVLSILTRAGNTASDDISNAAMDAMRRSAESHSLVLKNINPLEQLSFPG